MSERLLVGTRKGLLNFERRPAGWQLAGIDFLAEPVSAVLADPRDGRVYAALKLGHFGCKLHRRDGETWTEVAVPSYPPEPDDPAEKKGTYPWTLDQVWCLETDGRAPGGLWAGTNPGGLFHSADGGESWELLRSLWDRPERAKWFGGGYDVPGIHSVLVDPRDADQVTVAVSCAGVWHTGDGGANWEQWGEGMVNDYMPEDQQGDPATQDVHRLVACPARPERLWNQHHGGAYRSDDGGRTFQPLDIQPSSFGFAVAVHPHDPDTAWYVPAKVDMCRLPVDLQVVVSRTSDGGQSWEVFRDGLPQENAFDLVYRHGLDVDETGNRLAVASSTGSLWVSEDGGERWQTVSEHLPPVYAVRFVAEGG